MKSNESEEMYLETILILGQTHEHVRLTDVANDLDYKKSSVSVALKHLLEKNLIEKSPEGYIILTPAGKEIAEMIYERHKFISTYLMKLGVSETVAVDDACKIEHVISKESFDAIKKYVKKNNL